MKQFAIASVYPRSIVWLLRVDEWDRFETIIKYNCAMVGGFFNVIIPLTDRDTVSEEYTRFLVDYDPDLIVLAPGMASLQLEPPSIKLYPFETIIWEDIRNVATLDPCSGGTGLNTTMGSKILFQKESSLSTFVAVADETQPDTSRLALVACGDIEPREPMWHVMDDNVTLSATGYREIFLSRLLSTGHNLTAVEKHEQGEAEIVPAPDCYQLAALISEANRFPLDDTIRILEVCCKLQYSPSSGFHLSFIGLTAKYSKEGSAVRTYNHQGENTPSMVMLVSNSFRLYEAILFWNLRASGFIVTWLPFDAYENNLDAIAKWLESDYGGTYYAMMKGKCLDIVFSCPDDDIAHLQRIFADMNCKRKTDYPKWRIASYISLVSYDYVRPLIMQDRVVVLRDSSRYSFVPKLPQEYISGEYTVTLEWSGLMLPQNRTLVHNKISSDAVRGFLSFRRYKDQNHRGSISRFRITKDRYLAVQASSEQPIEFDRPSPEQIIETLFSCSGFTRIERSSAAKFHTSFIQRAGGLEAATHYLATMPYRELLALLSDNSNKNRPGWILDTPSKRRTLHHFALCQVLGKAITPETKTYFDTDSDLLPAEAIDLLRKHLLERGFFLKCNVCSFKSWYPAEHIGQTFECARCFQTQVYESNPLWLYKLPEVIFQGFQENMDVPLLALGYLKRLSRHAFEWVPDSNVYLTENGREQSHNIDILCLCDGKLYVGEAKSNNEIDAKQFAFYEDICRRVQVDSIRLYPDWSCSAHRSKLL